MWTVVGVALVVAALVAAALVKRYQGSSGGSSGSPSSTPAALGPHSVGYVGCSNTRDSVTGYHAYSGDKDLFWPSYDTGGGAIEKWADPNSSYWGLFDQQVARYGQPSVVWVELCEQTENRLDTYAEVQELFANLKRHAPNAAYYISAINAYDPYAGLCAFMGTTGQGESDTENWRDGAVAAGLAKLGPPMGPLTSSNTISDGCHPSAAGERLLGGQLAQFFDTL